MPFVTGTHMKIIQLSFPFFFFSGVTACTRPYPVQHFTSRYPCPLLVPSILLHSPATRRPSWCCPPICHGLSMGLRVWSSSTQHLFFLYSVVSVRTVWPAHCNVWNLILRLIYVIFLFVNSNQWTSTWNFVQRVTINTPKHYVRCITSVCQQLQMW